jgi:hypothetical protein
MTRNGDLCLPPVSLNGFSWGDLGIDCISFSSFLHLHHASIEANTHYQHCFTVQRYFVSVLLLQNQTTAQAYASKFFKGMLCTVCCMPSKGLHMMLATGVEIYLCMQKDLHCLSC